LIIRDEKKKIELFKYLTKYQDTLRDEYCFKKYEDIYDDEICNEETIIDKGDTILFVWSRFDFDGEEAGLWFEIKKWELENLKI